MGEQHIVALDTGGSKTRVALFTGAAHPEADIALDSFPTEERYEAQLDLLTNAISTITKGIRFDSPAEGALTNVVSDQTNVVSNQTNRISYQTTAVSNQTHHISPQASGIRIGASIGARLASDGSGVAVAPNLREYEGRPFARDLAERCGLPARSVRLAHDPVCGLLAERRFGVLQDSSRCAYVTVSTGTGAAIYLGPDDGSGQALSIEFGHQLLDGDTRKCLCGQAGCLETYTGGRQLARRYERPLEEIEDAAVWDALYEKLALGLVNLAQLTRVEVVALSGSIALKHEGFLDALRERVRARLRGMTLRLELAALGEQAPLVGAALLPLTPERAILH